LDKEQTYTPDCWVVFKTEEGQEHYRILAGWDGNYKDKDGKFVKEEWKVSGGVTGVFDDGDYYHFYTSANTTYTCSKHNWGMKDCIYHVWQTLSSEHQSTMLKKVDYTDINWKL